MLEVAFEIEKFAKEVQRLARYNLTKYKVKDKGNLYSKFTYKIKVSARSFELKFDYPIYGKFQDEGVNGTVVKHGSPYSFKAKAPPSKPIELWAKRKGIRFRNKEGKFQKGNSKAIGYVVAQSIKKKGIKPKRWFSKAFETKYKTMGVTLEKAFGKDVEKMIKKTLSDV